MVNTHPKPLTLPTTVPDIAQVAREQDEANADAAEIFGYKPSGIKFNYGPTLKFDYPITVPTIKPSPVPVKFDYGPGLKFEYTLSQSPSPIKFNYAPPPTISPIIFDYKEGVKFRYGPASFNYPNPVPTKALPPGEVGFTYGPNPPKATPSD